MLIYGFHHPCFHYAAGMWAMKVYPLAGFFILKTNA